MIASIFKPASKKGQKHAISAPRHPSVNHFVIIGKPSMPISEAPPTDPLKNGGFEYDSIVIEFVKLTGFINPLVIRKWIG